MTQTASAPIDELRSRLRGEVIGADDPTYDESRRVWNAAVDRRPLAVARCADETDVQAAVRFAAANGLEVAVRGRARGIAGASVVEDGLVIGLGAMNEVVVDPDARRVRVGGVPCSATRRGDPGARPGVPVGLIAHTRVGRLTLGGGIGWLSRKYGLAIDNLLLARVVTAAGDVLVASEEGEPRPVHRHCAAAAATSRS